MADEVKLRIGGRDFSGWKEIEITRSIEAICGSFKLSVSQALGGDPFPIPENAEVQLLIGRDLYLSGYVDQVSVGYGDKDHSITVEGRDRASDLVDCSPAGLEVEYYNVGLLELAATIAAPFGLDFALAGGASEGEPFDRFALSKGETAFESLERACRMRGLLMFSDAKGKITLGNAGEFAAADAIVEGVNVAGAVLRIDNTQRFYKYTVLAQAEGTDLSYGPAANEIQGEAFDVGVQRQARELLLPAETSCDTDRAQKRAEWEANVRAARASSLTVTLVGWRQGPSGPLWVPNLLVACKLPRLKLEGTMLVAAVRLSLTKDEGKMVQLGLARADAFLPELPKPEDEVEFGEDLEAEE